MKLVMIFHEGDGCTYSCEHTLPIEYESAEAAAVDFERLARLSEKSRTYLMLFSGHHISVDCFFEKGIYLPPEILTVDEWFERAR